MSSTAARARIARTTTWVAALAGVVVARVIGRASLHDFPHVMDEIAYALQARMLESGRLTVPPHLPRAAFAMWFVDDRSATFSIFPPGWPAVLALGELLHARAWVNPLLHGATVLVVAATARRIAGRRAAAIAAVGYALSPQALLLAASLMSHTLVALLSAAVAWAGAGLFAGAPRTRDARVAGIAIGMLFLSRPLCAVVAVLGLATVLVAGFTRGRRAPIAWHGALLAPAILGVALLGAYNRALTGHATRFPQSAYFDEHAAPLDDPQFAYRPGCNDLGFGPSHGCDYGIANAAHDAKNALSNTGDNLRAWLLLAGGGPLVFVAAAWGAARARRRPVALALAAWPVAAIGLYALYWYAGTCYGARFFHAALPPLVILAALGVDRVASRRGSVFAVVSAIWLACNTVAVVGSGGEIAGAYWGTDDRFAQLARDWKRGDALVMVAFGHDRTPDRPSYPWTSFLRDVTWRNTVRAQSALAANTPSLDGHVVFAKYHPALVPELRGRFAGRELWLYIVEDTGEDRLERYDGSPLALVGRDAPAPRDNFDAFVITE